MWRSHYYRAKGADHELRVESRKFWPESSSSNADLLVTETTIVDGGMTSPLR